eukprot:GEMP01012172.1.p1 GENE.GEMP01012172.1~~GEMP01012172.1.p1  ORF type:complete len:889 (+),score=176.53 GEMP01012172.1:190-2856(+)
MTFRILTPQTPSTSAVFSPHQDVRLPEAAVFTSRDGQPRSLIQRHEPIPSVQRTPLLYRNFRGKLQRRPSPKTSRSPDKLPSTSFSSVAVTDTLTTPPISSPQSGATNVFAPRAPSLFSRKPSATRQQQSRPASRSSPAQTVDQYLGYAASYNAPLVKDLIQLGQWRVPQCALGCEALAEVFAISQDGISAEGAVIAADAVETAKVARLTMEALQDLPRNQATQALQDLIPHLLRSIYSDDFSQPECAKPYFSVVTDYHQRLLESEANRLKLETCLEETRAELEKQLKEREGNEIASKRDQQLYRRVIDDFYRVKSDYKYAELKILTLEETLKKSVEKHEAIQIATIKQKLEEKSAKEAKTVKVAYLLGQTLELKNELDIQKEATDEARKEISELVYILKEYQEKEKNALRALEKGDILTSPLVELMRQVRPDVYAILTGLLTNEQSSTEYAMVMKIAKACSRQLWDRMSSMNPAEATDCLMEYLNTMNQELEGWQLQQAKHKEEIQRLMDLTPHWNKDLFDDVRRAFQNKNHPLELIASHRDTRPFSGLGMDPNVPTFLQVEGFVKHRFVSKVELQRFMAEFWSWRKEKVLGDPKFTDFEKQLTTYLEEIFAKHPDERFEFAYALVHSLNTYISDPDFWIFAQIIDNCVPASIVDDQMEMLTHIENLLVECDMTPSTESTTNRVNRTAKQPPTTQTQETDSKKKLPRTNVKIINAVLCEVFPAKSVPRLNILREALHNWSKTQAGNSMVITELFSEDIDCSQSCFVEELRKQHCREVVEFQDAFITKMHRPQRCGQIVDIELKQTICAVEEDVEWQQIWLNINVDGNDGSAQSILTQFQKTRLFRPSNLWVRATKSAVAKALSSSSAVKNLNWPTATGSAIGGSKKN